MKRYGLVIYNIERLIAKHTKKVYFHSPSRSETRKNKDNEGEPFSRHGFGVDDCVMKTNLKHRRESADLL